MRDLYHSGADHGLDRYGNQNPQFEHAIRQNKCIALVCFPLGPTRKTLIEYSAEISCRGPK